MQKSLDSIVLTNYIKYERLKQLIDYTYAGSSATKINIFIDLYPILRSVYSDTYQVNYHGFMDMVPLLINLCAHYRYFFSRFYSVHATIYLVAGTNTPSISKMLIPEYNFVMQKRENGPAHAVMDDMIKKNLKILDIMTPYLPDIHFVETEFETSVAMGYIIDNNKSGDPNIIISKDIYPIQLAANDRFKNTTFIKPVKFASGEDVSVVIQSSEKIASWEDFWFFICKERGITIPDDGALHPSNVVPIFAMSGIPERSLKSLTQFRSVYRMIYQIIGSAATQCSIDSLYMNFPKLDGAIPRHTVENRIHVIDVPYQLDALYSVSTEAQIMKFENKHDPDTIKAICSKYFSNNIPIMLDKL